MREHCSEWADPGVDAYSAALVEGQPIRSSRHTLEHEEVFWLEGHGFRHDEVP